KAFAIARDGTCVWPGCTRDAQHCQLDHRVPYADGGSTTPANLFSLCQRHHNVKTDRRAYYIPDPTTGDIV
ncbi:HNH endonuclease, partial [Corynebacterium sanguinis]